MENTIHTQVQIKIKELRFGQVFYADIFHDIGNLRAVSKALERMVKRSEIERLTHGVYYKKHPIHPILGTIHPAIEDIAEAIAKRDGVRIIPTGEQALNKLGFSEQVPTNAVYLTDGAKKRLKIGNRTIVFKESVAKNFAPQNEVNRLLIQALRTIGKDHITEQTKHRILDIINKQTPDELTQDLKYAPEWIKRLIENI